MQVCLSFQAVCGKTHTGIFLGGLTAPDARTAPAPLEAAIQAPEPTLIVIGAAHLAGATVLLRLLNGKGHRWVRAPKGHWFDT